MACWFLSGVVLHHFCLSIVQKACSSPEAGRKRRSLEGRTGFSGVPIFVAGVSLGGCISVDLCRQTVSPEVPCAIVDHTLSMEILKSGQYSFSASCSRTVGRWPSGLQDTQQDCFKASIEYWWMQDVYKGAVLLAPMLSLDRVSKAGLNPYLRS